MSYVLNPEQIKRREFGGLTALGIGIVSLLGGIVCLMMSLIVGLVLTCVGASCIAAGIFVLTKIPDVLGQPEELW